MQETKNEDIEITMDELFTDVKGYLKVRAEYLRFYAVERVTKVFANLVTNMAVVISFILAFIFGSVTLAFYLSGLLGGYTQGFGAVAIIYILLAILVFVTKNTFLERAITNFAIKQYFNKLQDEEEEENETV